MQENLGEERMYKELPRGSEEIRRLTNRLSRIVGQLNGIKTMIAENRYCKDVLEQVAAAESALRSFAYLVFEEHMHTCVCEKIRAGDENIVDETVELIKRLR